MIEQSISQPGQYDSRQKYMEQRANQSSKTQSQQIWLDPSDEIRNGTMGQKEGIEQITAFEITAEDNLRITR